MNWIRNFQKIVLVLSVGFLVTGCVFYSTKTTEVGVRTRKISWANKGIENQVYPPGATYIFLPFVNDWHTFDTRLQNIEMTIDPTRGDLLVRDDLLFKTIDGNDISLDIIISYRIDPAKAPHILEFVARNDHELRHKIVRTIARSRPRDIFGQLKTEEFYNAKNRSDKANLSKDILNGMLGEYGVIVERVLTKDYRFNEAYQAAIEDKKVADQRTEQFKSATNAKKEEYLKKLEEAGGENNKLIAQADGNYEQAKIEADAYYEQQKRISQAIIAEGRAEAKGIRKLNEALAGSGGAVMVKLKIAEQLKGKKILLVPAGSESGLNLKTMDVNGLLNTYGLKSIATPKDQPPPSKSR